MITGIIGAGISGLTLAWHLQQRGQPYFLWEAGTQPGGYIRSQTETLPDGRTYLYELGPNSLLGDQALLDWLAELGLASAIVLASPVSKARFIYRQGKYRQLPAGPPSLLFGQAGEPPFFSWRTKWAMFLELWNSTTSPSQETLAQFFRRRFSDELVDYALGPFVAGIFAGDPEQLLVSETFPILLTYEQKYGSVLRGFMKNQSISARRQSFSFRDGMQVLPTALANQLTALSLNNPVQQIEKQGTSWLVKSATGNQLVDRLVLTGPADATAQLIDLYYPEMADALRHLNYPPMTVVHSAYKRTDVTHPLNGFGGLNPALTGQFSAGHIWSSSIFDGRCPTDEVLFTTFVGGVQYADNARQPDCVLLPKVEQELTQGFGIQAATPTFRRVYRWERAIPQYDKNLLAVKKCVPMLERDGLLMCTNWNEGVSLSDCITKARKLAAQLA